MKKITLLLFAFVSLLSFAQTQHERIDVKGLTCNGAACSFKGTTQDKGFINAVSDCGVPSDLTTDICTTAQACITANPGKKILFPNLTSSIVTPSYLSSCRLSASSSGTVIAGEVASKYLGGTKIRFSSGVGGIIIATTCANCGVQDIFLEGGDLANSDVTTTYEDYSSLAQVTGMATSGITISGGSATVKGVRVSSFKGHGIEVVGDSGGFPDFWHVSDSYLDYNRGFGLFVKGTDSNIGSANSLSLEGNNLGGIYEESFYGNTYSMVHTSKNARNGAAAGANKTISGIVVASNVATITTSTAHGWSVGQWITTAPTDGTFASTGRILSTPTTTTATYNFTKADSSTGAGGTAATSSGAQVLAYYTAKGIATGPFSIHSSNGGTLIDTPYAENNQSTSVYGAATLTLNQQGIATSGASTGHHIYAHSEDSVRLFGGHWIFIPKSSGDLMILRNVANTTNMWQADITGTVVQKGTLQLGTNPATVNYFSAGNRIMGLPNATSINFRNFANNGDIRALYMHTDDFTHIGNNVIDDGSLSVATTLGVTGVSTLTGGAKIGAGGTTISDSRELVQSVHDCGTTTTCANTANLSEKIVRGSVALSSGTPSTAVVTGITAFGGNTAAFYSCWLTNETTQANPVKYARTSSSSITITGPNTVTDVISYLCVGH